MRSVLMSSSLLKASDDKDELRNEIVWGTQEETLQNADADVLEIFDWLVKRQEHLFAGDDSPLAQLLCW